MRHFFTTCIVVGLGIASSLIYTHSDIIKAEILKQKGIMRAEILTINFFSDLLDNDSNISLDDAILKFENKSDEFNNLKDFAKSKHRTVENYRKAYSYLFKRAKLKNNFF